MRKVKKNPIISAPRTATEIDNDFANTMSANITRNVFYEAG